VAFLDPFFFDVRGVLFGALLLDFLGVFWAVFACLEDLPFVDLPFLFAPFFVPAFAAAASYTFADAVVPRHSHELASIRTPPSTARESDRSAHKPLT